MVLGILTVVIWNATNPKETGPAPDGLAQAGASRPPQMQQPPPDSRTGPNEPDRRDDTPPPAPEKEKASPGPKEPSKEAAPRPPPDGDAFVGRRAGELKRLMLGSVELVFCWCPPGTFKMGSPPGEEGRDDDEDQVEVEIKQGFWMLRTEVTQALYELVMNENASRFQSPGNPVESVSWEQANDCAARLTAKLHQAGLLPEKWAIRLPTEAQWEYSCRAGPGGTGAFAFGDSLSSTQANFDGNSPYGGAAKGPNLQKTTAVASYQPNAWGLHDMHGNVWEWCADSYQKRLPGGVDPFVVPDGASARVVRGGSWVDGATHDRAADRGGIAPTYRFNYLGFRLAAVR